MSQLLRMARPLVLVSLLGIWGCRDLVDPEGSDTKGQSITLPNGQSGTLIGTLGGFESEARGVNDAGVVVGWSRRADGSQRAFKWTLSSGMQELLPTMGTSVANDAAGDFVVGNVDPTAGFVLFRLGPDSLQILPYLPGGFYGEALAVNSSGTVAGYSDNGATGVAAIWNANGTPTALGFLQGDDWSEAWDINNAGVVVGYSSDSNTGVTRAFKWSASSGMQALPTPAGGSSEAYGINSSGYVAGTIDGQAIVWRPDGSTITIGSGSASDINDLGDVIGRMPGGAFVWDSVQGVQTLTGPNSGFPAINSTGLAVASARNNGAYSAFYWQIVPGPPQAPIWTVSCDASVVRGDNVTCEGRLSAPVAYTVIERIGTLSGTTWTVNDTIDRPHAAGDVHSWTGMAVLNTRVKITVQYNYNGQQQTESDSADFVVQARQWAPPIPQPIDSATGRHPRFAPWPNPNNAVLGVSGVGDIYHYLQRFEMPRDSSGPNAGLAILPEPGDSALAWHAYFHPALFPVPPGVTPGSPDYDWHGWHDDQNGIGSGTCTNSVFSILVPEVFRHEGLTKAQDSHWGKAVAFYNLINPFTSLEALFDDGTDEDLRTQAQAEFAKFHRNSGYSATQAQFDTVDYNLIFNQRLGCSLDLFRYDNG